ncbi:UNVERIFIED_CONTAM: hypothetical protein PYX00_007798 [Menopon gallinae]|uniref:Dipeptidyl peptidase 3 n=1 Tax=Menopon gallinae TaxID=328185 RepID=A0AAW2HK81_9NEOP
MTAVNAHVVSGTSSENQSEKRSKIDSQFILHVSTPVVELDVDVAFKNLTPREKLYAHYLSKASWYGSLICLIQGSPESPLIFSLILRVFGEQPVHELQKLAVENGVSLEDFQALLVYAAGVLDNLANYKSFGDTKFVPAAPMEVFEKVIMLSNVYKMEPKKISSMWQEVKTSIYSLSDKEKTLGFPDQGITTYMSPNCTKADTDLVNKYLRHIGMEAYNTRVFKTQDENNEDVYEIRIASAESGFYPNPLRDNDKFGCATFRVTRGDYSPLLGYTVEYLKKAKEYVANDTERLMLEKYIESFETGSLDAHKDGSRYWIKNKGPVVETYIGFIETYRDPAGERADFTGWVAFVNKKRSANFAKLVESAERILPDLPWGRSFEKDVFLKPDFTSLDVLTFANCSVPAGINIPNYDTIRQNEGYKNVSLGNVISSAPKEKKISFLSPEDQELIKEYRTKSFEVQVGLHELLGHGSGKLFRMDANGELNFDIVSVVNPLTGEDVKMWYGPNETYDSKFTVISSSYEECRAEAVGLYLSLNPEVLQIFGYEGREAEKLVYTNWLSMMWNVIANGPDSYCAEKKVWLQAHAQARYVLLRVLMEAGEGLITVTETDPGKDLLLSLDRTKIYTVGKKAIADFLLKLQVYKSTGDIKSAEAMYRAYSEVPEKGSPWANWRKIAFLHMKPRRMFLQANTVLKDGEVILKRYEPSFTGIIQSWMDRFDSIYVVHRILEDLWLREKAYFH